MGIVGGDSAADNAGAAAGAYNGETQFHQDIEVTFSMSGTTDNGLSFGASVQLDEAGSAGGAVQSTDQVYSVFISGAFGTLTMGDTDGGFDWGMSEVPTGSGSIADNETGHAGWNGNAGLDSLNEDQTLRYDHSIGGLGFAVSVQLDDSTATNDNVVGLGLRYSMGDLGIGIGYQTSDDYDIAGVSLAYSMGDLALGLNYSSLSKDGDPDDQNHVGIGMSYTMDAITIGMNYGSYENYGHVAGADRTGFGLSAGYDLGGGASILLGYGTTTDHTDAASEDSRWSLGVAMSF